MSTERFSPVFAAGAETDPLRDTGTRLEENGNNIAIQQYNIGLAWPVSKRMNDFSHILVRLKYYNYFYISKKY